MSLLESEGLPVKDLPGELHNFLVSINDARIIGVIGLERYENYGLLRSLVVDRNFRNKDVASALVGELESLADSLELDAIYLLTETAPNYFERKGYKRIERNEVPLPVQSSSEFSSTCPVSAIVMKKSIK
jgi:amino-acid N-acetyltransferase